MFLIFKKRGNEYFANVFFLLFFDQANTWEKKWKKQKRQRGNTSLRIIRKNRQRNACVAKSARATTQKPAQAMRQRGSWEGWSKKEWQGIFFRLILVLSSYCSSPIHLCLFAFFISSRSYLSLYHLRDSRGETKRKRRSVNEQV